MAGCIATAVCMSIIPIRTFAVNTIHSTAIVGQSARGNKPHESGCRTTHTHTHSHIREIEDFLNRGVSLVPILGDHKSGIIAVSQFDFSGNRINISDDIFFQQYRSCYEQFPFIEVTKEQISLKDVVGTPNIKVSVKSQADEFRWTVSVALDNLYAGSASHAIMIMNNKFDLPIMTGLI